MGEDQAWSEAQENSVMNTNENQDLRDELNKRIRTLFLLLAG